MTGTYSDDICEDELAPFNDILGTWVESSGKEYSDFIKQALQLAEDFVSMCKVVIDIFL